MAKATAAAKPAKKPVERALKRPYTVVEVLGNVLTVLDPAVDARTQAEAMDIVNDRRSPEARKGRLGAFLFAGYREHEYESAQQWTTKATPHAPSFARPAEVASTNGSSTPAAD